MENKDIASKVLDYWFAIEFLGQDSYAKKKADFCF